MVCLDAACPEAPRQDPFDLAGASAAAPPSSLPTSARRLGVPSSSLAVGAQRHHLRGERPGLLLGGHAARSGSFLLSGSEGSSRSQMVEVEVIAGLVGGQLSLTGGLT